MWEVAQNLVQDKFGTSQAYAATAIANTTSLVTGLSAFNTAPAFSNAAFTPYNIDPGNLDDIEAEYPVFEAFSETAPAAPSLYTKTADPVSISASIPACDNLDSTSPTRPTSAPLNSITVNPMQAIPAIPAVPALDLSTPAGLASVTLSPVSTSSFIAPANVPGAPSLSPSALDPIPEPTWKEVTYTLDTPPGAPGAYSPTNITPPTLHDIGAAPGRVSVREIPIPAEPTLATVAVPQLVYPVLPSKPAYTVPDFDADIPEFEGELNINEYNPEPVVVEISNNIRFVQNEIDSVFTLFTRYIADPESVMSEEFKQLNRAQLTQVLNDEFDSKYTETLNFYAARGWNMPQGAMVAKLSEIDRLRFILQGNIARDVTLKDFELTQQRILAYTQMVPQYATALHSISSFLVSTAFELSKYTFETGLRMYNAYVEKFKVDIEIYKVGLAAYEAQISVLKAGIELYASELAAYKAGVEAEVSKIEVYKASVQAQLAVVDIYKARVEACAVSASYNKAIVDAYKAEVDAYIAAQSINTINVQLYQAQVAGEEAKVKAYTAQIQAYAANIDAIKSRSTVILAEAQAAAELNRSKAAIYSAQIQAATAELAHVDATNELTVKQFSAQLQAYSAALDYTKAANAEVLSIAQLQVENNKNELMRVEADLKRYEADIAAKADSNKMTIAAFEQSLQSYNAGVEASKASAQMSIQEATLRAEYNKDTIAKYAADTNMYIAELEGKVKKNSLILQKYDGAVKQYLADAQIQQVNAQINIANLQQHQEVIKGETTLYSAQIAGYTARADVNKSKNDGIARTNAAINSVAEANARIKAIQGELQVKAAEISMRNNTIAFETQVKQAEMNMRAATDAAQLQMEAMKAAASVSAQIAASSLSAVSAGAALHAQGSFAENTSNNTNYNYQYTG